ncbi:SDR family NAD(P)-dependent oxidoreductase [Aspergillus thermomutatus]|uniref:Ketoreductase domain-containing protein n=1 Tax=Aspergillus thermomutatus TaxID=41047 RepID=A0A397G1E1_ASPTH|nr:uncharacterized protein CDV56_102393 [Aspergillus thermomutatus]RHZ43889.1 hypothetical protein CDV56_102393 [Aspergillus thermomutatus]
MAPSSQPLTLTGKVAIVTGSSRGIGAGIAEELARRGAKVLITYASPRSERVVNELMERIRSLNNGSSVAKIQADLRELSAPQAIVNAAAQAFGPYIDILVNNAGCEITKPLADHRVDDYNFIFELNVRAVIFLTQAVLPHLQAPGRIINLSSIGARGGFANISTYCASKAAVESLTRCWAAELGDRGHTVNAVNPGPVQTEMLDTLPRDLIALQKSITPVEHRLGTVDDIAQIVAWMDLDAVFAYAQWTGGGRRRIRATISGEGSAWGNRALIQQAEGEVRLSKGFHCWRRGIISEIFHNQTWSFPQRLNFEDSSISFACIFINNLASDPGKARR